MSPFALPLHKDERNRADNFVAFRKTRTGGREVKLPRRVQYREQRISITARSLPGVGCGCA